MEDSPLDDLLKTLEGSLVKLLETVRQDPWSLLIIQTLIWSFRRWAVHYLVSEDMTTNMHDYLWDSHIDLVSRHAPEGLQEFGVVWLSPTNVGDRVEMLEELNSYFLFIVDKLNRAIETGNDDEQNLLAVFLDDTLTDILGEWLEGRTEYRIYPDHTESSETFSSEKIFFIMQRILEKNARPRVEVVVPPVEGASAVLETLAVPPVVEPALKAAPEPALEPEQPLEPKPEPAPPQPTPLHITIAAALKRRKTLRLHGRRASDMQAPNRASTRKRRALP